MTPDTLKQHLQEATGTNLTWASLHVWCSLLGGSKLEQGLEEAEVTGKQGGPGPPQTLSSLMTPSHFPLSFLQ